MIGRAAVGATPAPTLSERWGDSLPRLPHVDAPDGNNVPEWWCCKSLQEASLTPSGRHGRGPQENTGGYTWSWLHPSRIRSLRKPGTAHSGCGGVGTLRRWAGE